MSDEDGLLDAAGYDRRPDGQPMPARPNPELERRRLTRLLGGIAAAAVVLIAGAWILNSAINGDRNAARDACRDYIEEYSDTPSTIEWVEEEVEPDGEDRYRVEIQYDAENLAGALVRHGEICYVEHGEDPFGRTGWHVVAR